MERNISNEIKQEKKNTYENTFTKLYTVKIGQNLYFFTSAALLMRLSLAIVVIANNFNNEKFILNMRFDQFELFCQRKTRDNDDINHIKSI